LKAIDLLCRNEIFLNKNQYKQIRELLIKNLKQL